MSTNQQLPKLERDCGYLVLSAMWLLDNNTQKHSPFCRLAPPSLSKEHVGYTDTEWPEIIIPIVVARLLVWN